MAKVTEGRLEFDFPNAQSVERLDQTGTPLPHGMALVDFVVEETKRTLLIEIKDPEGAPASHRAKALEDFVRKMQGDGLIHQELVPSLMSRRTPGIHHDCDRAVSLRGPSCPRPMWSGATHSQPSLPSAVVPSAWPPTAGPRYAAANS